MSWSNRYRDLKNANSLVFVTVAVCYKDLASDPSGYCLGCIHEFRKLFYKCIVIFSSVSETLWSFLPFFLTFSSFLWANFREEDKALDETENHFTEHARHHHHHHLNHTEGKCEFCDYIRVKRLLEHLNKWVFQILQWLKRIFCLKLLQRKRWAIIPRAQMGSDSIAHEAEGPMG